MPGVRIAPFFLLLGVLLLHAFYYYPYFVDDAFISMRYAARMAANLGLTWNDGERVEGYSNFLWILLLADLIRMKFDPVSAARLMGLGCTLLTAGVLFWHAHKRQLPDKALWLGLATYALTPAVAIWAMGGLETPMVMLLFALAVMYCQPLLHTFSRKNAAMAGFSLGLLCLLRPEGPLYVIAIAAGLLLHSQLPWQRRVGAAFLISVIAALFFFMHLALRLAYYGQWVPNTVLAKVALTPEHMVSGLVYAANGCLNFLPLLCYILFAWLQLRGRPSPARSFLSFLLSIFLIVTLAIIPSGGDIFPGFRAFVPLVPLLALGIMEGVAQGLTFPKPRKELLFACYILLCHVWLQFSMNMNLLPKHLQWEQDAAEIGLMLKNRYGEEKPLIAVYAAGAIPFYSELPALDVFGLNDNYLTRKRSEHVRFGKALPGHELFDGDYVNSRKPGILVFDVPGILPLCDMQDHKEECAKVLPQYRQEWLEIPGHRVKIWVRKSRENR